MDVSYRSIARLLARGMPVEGQEYSEVIESLTKSIKAMPVEQQSPLKAAYIFSSLAPREERQDLFQTLVEQCLTELAKYDGHIKDLEAFCYTVARHKWGDKWKQKKNRAKILNGGFVSLNKVVPSTHQDGDIPEVELHELLAGKLEWTTIRPTNLESEINSELDSQAALDTLPDRVKAIVIKKLLDSGRISSSECNILHRHIKQNGHKIRETA